MVVKASSLIKTKSQLAEKDAERAVLFFSVNRPL
jgi:hypothetical protein